MTDSTVDTTPSSETASSDPADGSASLSADSLVVDIVERLAVARGDDPLDIPPLNDYVDVDALATLFRSTADGTPTLFGTVTFYVEDHEVRVYHDGTIFVHRPDRGAKRSTTSGSSF